MNDRAYLLSQQETLQRDPAHRALLARAAPLADTPGGSLAQRLRAAADETGRLAGHDHPAALLLREAASATDSGSDWGKASGKTRLALKALGTAPPAPPAGGSADWSSWLSLRVRVGTLATALRRRHRQADPAAPQPRPDAKPRPLAVRGSVVRANAVASVDPRVIGIAEAHPMGTTAPGR